MINITYHLKKICGRFDGTQCELLFTSKINKIQINICQIIWRFYCNQQRILYGSFRITSRINPRHQYHPESYTGCDTERAISYYVYHILKHEQVLFCIMNLQARDQYHFKGHDKGVMISISVTADKYSRNVLSVLYMQISFIQY